MNRRIRIILYLLGLVVGLAAAVFQNVPGYMDAEYYFSGGLQLFQGKGFQEPFIWNFLADPSGLPSPSHAYWMPLASILAATGMKVLDSASFWAGKLPFLLLAACIPPLTAQLAARLYPGNTRALWFAGLLAVFSGFYLVYLPTSDTFGIYMVLGALYLMVCGAACPKTLGLLQKYWLSLQPFLVGSLAAGMHLARADGILWLFIGLAWILLTRSSWRRGRQGYPTFRMAIAGAAWMLAGYLVWMGPWLLRNLAVFGAPLAPGGTQVLWLTEYDELYAFPASILTPARWWASGPNGILAARWQALALNLQTALAVQGSVFLTPFILAGLWVMRRRTEVRQGVSAWALTFLAMTLVFPFAGSRGGFFHSGAALQPLFWVAAAAGLEAFVQWGVKRRGWRSSVERPIFQILFLAVAALLSMGLAGSRLGFFGGGPVWYSRASSYQRVELALQTAGALEGEPVLVNNAPGYYLAAGRPGVSIPYGDAQTVLEVARRYQIRYLLLEMDQVQGASELYTAPRDRPGFDYIITKENVRIYRLQP